MNKLSPEQEKLKEKLRKLSNNISQSIQEDRSNKVGRVLTVTDSAISDPDQRKAVKSLVENAIYGDMTNEVGGTLGGRIMFNIESLARSEGFELWNTLTETTPAEPINEYDI